MMEGAPASAAPAAPASASAALVRPKKRTGTSKYDFFKVKVWLGALDHYYILSRFLICRMLTVTKIPYIKAVKIALETKKHFVDNNLTDVTQAQLEGVLFGIIRDKGFDEAHIDCYRMVTQFYQSRQPLVIILCGTAWTGKSSLAQQLASRINIPNVMQADVIYELLRAEADSPLHPLPLWGREGLSGGRCCDAALVAEFRREARVVRKGMDGDLIKTLSDGKPIIIEGLHLDPGLYIPDFAAAGLIMLPARPSLPAVVPLPNTAHAAVGAGRSPGSSPLAGRGRSYRSNSLPRVAAASAAASAGASPCRGAARGRASDTGRFWQQTLDEEGQEGQQQQQHGSMAAVSVSPSGPLAAADRLGSGGAGASAAAAAGALRLLSLHAGASVKGDSTGQQQGSSGQGSRGSSSSTAQQDAAPSDGCSNNQQGSSGAALPVPHKQRRHSPFASATAAEAAAAAQAAEAPSPVRDSLLGSPEQPAVVVVLDEMQVSAAAAEAVALQQYRQQQPRHAGGAQQQLQQQLVTPASPFSWDSDGSSAGALGGASPPCISVEHSTTEVISRVCSCASLGSPALGLSHEPSGNDVGTPAPAGAAGAGAAGAAAAGQLCKQPSNGCFFARQHSGGLRLRAGAAVLKPDPPQQRQQLPPLLPAQQQRQHQQLPQQQQQDDDPGQPNGSAALQQPCSTCGGLLQPEQERSRHQQGAGTEPAVVPLASSLGAADKQQQPQPDEPDPVGKPLFVPILVYMDEADHLLMAEEALAHLGLPTAASQAVPGSQGGAGQPPTEPAQHVDDGAASRVGPDGGSGSSDVTLHEALRRMRLLQEYLCAYEAQGLPVVKVSYGAMSEALDKLHEYILQCIKVATASSRLPPS